MQQELYSQYQNLMNGVARTCEDFNYKLFLLYIKNKQVTIAQWKNIAVISFQQIFLFNSKQPDQIKSLLQQAIENYQSASTKATYREQNNKQQIWLYNAIAAIYLKQAVVNENNQELDNVLKIINKSQKIDIQKNLTFALKGFTKLYQGQLQQASSFLKDAIRIYQDQDKGKCAITMLGLGQLYFSKKQYNEALNCYKKALTLNPRLPAKARLGMGLCFYFLKKYQLAELCFRRILQMDNSIALAHLYLAKLFLSKDEEANYFKHVQIAYSLQKDNAFILLHICQHYYMIKDSQKTIQIGNRGLSLVNRIIRLMNVKQQIRNDYNQICSRFNYLIGSAYHIEGRYQTAFKYLTLARGFKPSFFLIIQIYQQNFSEAIKTLQHYRKIIPVYNLRKLDI